MQSSSSDVHDEWHVVRGLAERANRRIIEPRRVLLTGMLAILAVGVVVGVLLVALAIRDRLPLLTSAARAEVAALATRFRARSAPHAGVSTNHVRQPSSRSHRLRGHERRAIDDDADQLGPNAAFDAYLLIGGRRYLLRSGRGVALVDLRTGRIGWVGGDSTAAR